jgi:geranylgeranyl diphosphate synthase type I
MFTLARMALHGLSEQGLPAQIILQACQRFDEACLQLTEGQYLDMSFEGRLDVTVEEYLEMIQGKTAALISASLELGALVAGAPADMLGPWADFGRSLGLAFQIQDDLLGIWGDEAMTGKSAVSDIVTRKKSLPVVYGLVHPETSGAMRELYAHPLATEDVPAALALLDRAGARAYAQGIARQAHDDALAALRASGVLEDGNEAGQALLQIAQGLLNRSR